MNETNWVKLQVAPLSVEGAVAFVSCAEAGAIDIFLGTTRTEKSVEGKELIALDYDAYEEMAQKQLVALAEQALRKWPVSRLVILHRLGRVLVGEPSVIIAVSTPHRADSFEACRWIIDQLKKDAAIWKKEIWSDGEATWVHPKTKSP